MRRWRERQFSCRAARRRHRSGKTKSISKPLRKSSVVAGSPDPDAGDRADGQFLDRFAHVSGSSLEWHSELTPRTSSATGPRSRRAKPLSSWAARSALFCPMPISAFDHRRRGARSGLKAGRRRALSCPRHGGGARPYRQDSDRAGSATPSSRPRSTRARAAISAWCCRRGSAASTCRISRRSICAARRRCAAASSRASGGAGSDRGGARGRRFCSLIAAVRAATLFRACGHRFAALICDAWLVDHRFRKRLVLPSCGFSMPRPMSVRTRAEESLVPVGPGVERLQEEAASLFGCATWCCRAI